MSSLTTHLRRASGHAGLPFHPECPVCRHERLAGRVSANAIVAHRTLAAFTAGLLAVSAGAPPLAVAAGEPDQEQSGGAQAGPSPDNASDPDLDPGGPTSTTPDATNTDTPRPGDTDPDPPDPEPAKDTAAQVTDPGHKPGPQPDRQTGSATTQPPVKMPTAPSNPTSSAPPAPAAKSPRATLPPRPSHAPAQHPRLPKHTTRAPEPLGTSTPQTQPSLSSLQARSDATITEPSLARPAAAGARDARGAHRTQSGRVHVVVAGESLWSIARDQLGHGASDAEIASEVNRIWELNASRIATGSPDLIPVGTRLRLP